MNLFRSLILFANVIACAQAEHRVALVIGNDGILPRLEKLGFRCQSSANLSEKELSRLVESWSSTTPTNGTALFYFKGEVTQNGKDFKLVTTKNRGLSVTRILDAMHNRGGSIDNRVIIETDKQLPYHAKLPPGCSLGYADKASPAPSTPPSLAISPPDKFVPGEKIGDEWVNSCGMVFCWCPPGEYLAGSPPNTPGRYPNEEQREVVIGEGFWIGKYELTRNQNIRNRWKAKEDENKNEPLNDLHWDDGRRMISRTLTGDERKAGRLPEDWQYDLPSEEQWEYAARAGSTTRFYFGDDLALLPQHANFADKAFYDIRDTFSNHAHRTLDDGFTKLAPAGSFKPNPWGLHDVYGNVYEWCRDKGARGGSWITIPQNCRSAYRDHYSSRDNQIYLGYRIVIQPNVPDPKS